MSDNNWYETTGWYEPLKGNDSAKLLPAKKTYPRGKRGWTRARAIGLVVLMIALIVGSSLAFAKPRQDYFTFSWGTDDFSDALPDNREDFFDEYYDPVENPIGDSNIEKLEEKLDFSLKLESKTEDALSLQEIYSRCEESITAIYGYVEGEDGYFWGTGVVLSEDGLILTNAHIISGCDSATVKLSDDTEYEALLVGADTTSDLAVLKIEAEGLRPAVFGLSSELEVGDSVAAIGNPLGESFRSTLTDGIISAIERGINMNGYSMTLLQTNTALNEGNSGGALFNMYGQVVGITNMKMSSAYSSIEGMGFAIPSSTVKSVVNALVKDGEVRGRPSLGIVIGGIPQEAKEHYDLPDGLYVSEVREHSDAYHQGMRAGDVVTKVNFEPAESAEQINAIKNTLEVGDIMIFEVWRDGEILEFEVMLMDTNDVYADD